MLAATRPDLLVLRPSRGGARFVSVKGRARIAARSAATRFASALYHNPGGYRLLKAARVLRHPLEFARRRSASACHGAKSAHCVPSQGLSVT